MEVKIASASQAYADAIRRAAELSPDAARERGGPNFSDLLADFVTDNVARLREAEQAGMAKVAGEGDLVDLVTAITNAEVALETVIALRDKLVKAYQEIIRMGM